MARGMDPAAARAAALERFGDVDGVRGECTELLAADRRAEARRDWLDDLRQDLRFGVRSALRAPLFSLLAVVTLALGIGANAAVFGVVKSVLLDALPYADADRLVRVYASFENVGHGPLLGEPGRGRRHRRAAALLPGRRRVQLHHLRHHLRGRGRTAGPAGGPGGGRVLRHPGSAPRPGTGADGGGRDLARW